MFEVICSIPLITGNIDVAIAASLYSGLYTRCEYIQSSGTQYIDTGVIAVQNTVMEATFAWQRLTQAVTGLCLEPASRTWSGRSSLPCITTEIQN
jgi:hypothetical protein